MLAIFVEFERKIVCERVCAGIAQGREEGRPRGRPRTAWLKSDEVMRLKAKQMSHAKPARRVGIGRAKVRSIHARP